MVLRWALQTKLSFFSETPCTISDKCYFFTLTRKIYKLRNTATKKVHKSKSKLKWIKEPSETHWRKTYLNFIFMRMSNLFVNSPQLERNCKVHWSSVWTHHHCSGRSAQRVCRRSGTASCRSLLSVAWFYKESVWKKNGEDEDETVYGWFLIKHIRKVLAYFSSLYSFLDLSSAPSSVCISLFRWSIVFMFGVLCWTFSVESQLKMLCLFLVLRRLCLWWPEPLM